MPFGKLPERVRNLILYGSSGEPVRFLLEEGARKYAYTRPFEGVMNNLERRFRETDSEVVREDLARYMNNRPCRECGGARLKKEALFVRVGGKGIDAVTALSVKEALDFFDVPPAAPRGRRRSPRGSSRRSGRAWRSSPTWGWTT